ncbi:sensor domain-containing phosphodiesterase [Caminibacter pacificus]|uniref:EAL domain-containing protein n=1 Tax=Caminibacter pacificus TaxID=1424653 RepID=A0AAJ4UYF8_9BACT|nr:sensor domain-containing phosphodiesterase [Caminibacter pacificus]NPA88365.1 EAL domain-containing protein [Campylobacterota bacterium]QCI28512.1 EAL domain-containing protein [Caminibacter pacificus]ROR40763.1 PAS domain S-box-containing protein/diguanylate cyclase (GGDEF)-like protein [Caminibacter pacificus]
MTNEVFKFFEEVFKNYLETSSLSDKEKKEVYEKFYEILQKLFINFKHVLNSIREAVIVLNEKDEIIDVNESFLKWIHLKKEDVIGKKIDDFIYEDYNQKIIFLKNNALIPIEIEIQEFEVGHKIFKRLIALNIKQKVDIELKLKNLLRLYKILSLINELIIRAIDINDIYSSSCEILVKEGHFDFAWIGEIQNEKLIPKAWYGENKDFKNYLQNNEIPFTRINELIKNQYLKEDNLQNEEKVFCHKIMIPVYKEKNALSTIITHQDIKAVLVVYYKGKEFEEEEIHLLKQIAHDIGFGLVSLSRKEDIDYLAYYDVLTSLPNRRYFFEELESLLEMLKEKNQKGTLLIIDINNFKTINSTVGFWAGDIVLSRIADMLKKVQRKKDILARVGGDKFALFLYGVKTKEEAIYKIQTILKDFEYIFEIENKKFLVTVSVGGAFFPDDGLTKEILFASAEAALRESKKRGKGIEFYEESLQKTTLENLNLESELVESIKKDNFLVFYQPIIDIQNNKIAMAEALLRWKKDDKLVSPGEFIPILEERGLIKEVGAIVLDKVFKFIKNQNVDIPISINVSAKQIHLGFYKEVISLIEKYEIDPNKIILEITESVLMENLEILLKNMKELTKIGVRFEIDDFGTGYSSLAYLKKLPIFALKIDRTFIKDLPKNEEDISISKAIISMAHSLGKRVVAEGVEMAEQVEFLKENGCEFIQGFYFAKPMPQKDFIEFYNNYLSFKASK